MTPPNQEYRTGGRPQIDLTGQRFGSLVVTSFAHLKREVFWNAVCDCGGTLITRGSLLRQGRTTSCGCKKVGAHPKHGHAAGERTRTYQTWMAMKARCLRANHPWWRCYGGRGITVCERWMKFENFLADMGLKPVGLTLDRENNDGNYEPGNCRWATQKQQIHNRRPRALWDKRESA